MSRNLELPQTIIKPNKKKEKAKKRITNIYFDFLVLIMRCGFEGNRWSNISFSELVEYILISNSTQNFLLIFFFFSLSLYSPLLLLLILLLSLHCKKSFLSFNYFIIIIIMYVSLIYLNGK